MRTLILLFLQGIFILSAGQSGDPESLMLSNHIFDKRIKSVQLYKERWNLSYPILKLNSQDKLVLHFDLLDNQAESYNYSFIHCDKDWNRSDILPNDYTDGYAENPVEDYQSSFNTTVPYFHYQIVFPNDRVQLKLSGNYIILVCPADKPDSPVITRRFIITEEAVKIDVDVHRPLTGEDKDNRQQVDFTVQYPGFNVSDPNRNLYAFILQNGRWDNAKRNLKPDFYGASELKYNTLSDKNIFQGGNEFRYFDIKSIRYQSEYVKGIDFVDGRYNIHLTPSESREFKPYFYSQDFNGKYYVAIQEGKKFDIDADYVNVYFTLPSKEYTSGGDIYVSGGLNNWNFDGNNKMVYNPEKQEYECTMLLKQGWYNYEYVFLKNGTTDGTASLFEGSHYETENDYTVLIYYRNPLERYDRVIGSTTFNTLNRLSN